MPNESSRADVQSASKGPLAPRRVRELARFERLLAELSAGFVNIAAERVDDAVTDALGRIAHALDVDRVTLLRRMPDGAFVVSHSAAVEGVPAVAVNLAPSYPWVIGNMCAGRHVNFTSLDELPVDASVDKASWTRAQVRSNLTMPMGAAGRCEGALALGCLRRSRRWPQAIIERVRMLADVLRNALAYQRTQTELAFALRFEDLTSRSLAALVAARHETLDDIITAALRDAAQVLAAQRATLWQRAGNDACWRKTHRWLADGMPAPPEIADGSMLPWLSAELLGGRSVSGTLNELPAAAARDLPALRALAIESFVAVPLTIDGRITAALSFSTSRDIAGWPRSLVPRVGLFGEILASALARDRAELRERESRAEAAHAARVGTMGAVAASLAHELAQPVAAIMANAETAKALAAQSAIDVGELRATLDDILADNQRSSTLIAQLRRFLRRSEIERTAVDVRSLVIEVASLVRGEAIGRGIEVVIDAGWGLPAITANHAQLQQILLNLLLNAFDAVLAMPMAPRRVVIRALRRGDGVRIEVQDDGPGMDEATVARAFTPFFTTKANGMGLGLSISRSIAEAHGGSLTVVSAPGKGSVFALDLSAAGPS